MVEVVGFVLSGARHTSRHRTAGTHNDPVTAWEYAFLYRVATTSWDPTPAEPWVWRLAVEDSKGARNIPGTTFLDGVNVVGADGWIADSVRLDGFGNDFDREPFQNIQNLIERPRPAAGPWIRSASKWLLRRPIS